MVVRINVLESSRISETCINLTSSRLFHRFLLVFVYLFVACRENEKGRAVNCKRGRIDVFHCDELTVLSVIQTGVVSFFPAVSPSALHLHTEGSHRIRSGSCKNYRINLPESTTLDAFLGQKFGRLVIFSFIEYLPHLECT